MLLDLEGHTKWSMPLPSATSNGQGALDKLMTAYFFGPRRVIPWSEREVLVEAGFFWLLGVDGSAGPWKPGLDWYRKLGVEMTVDWKRAEK